MSKNKTNSQNAAIESDLSDDLLLWLNQEELWAFVNQRVAIEEHNRYEIGWSRGYRSAIEQVAKKLKLDLKKAG